MAASAYNRHPVSRRAAILLPLVVLMACAAAFLRAEQLKLRHSPVGHPHVAQAFSPGCTDHGCRPRAWLEFQLRSPQTLTLAIVDDGGHVITQLGKRRPFPKGPVALAWDGTDNAGAIASDGRYRLRVTLSSGRQLTIPDRIRLDTTPPHIAIGQVRHGRLALAIPYTRSGHDSHAELIAYRGRTPAYHKRRLVPRVAHLRYDALAPGRYRIELVAVDQAGNRSPNPPSFVVTIP
jgi:hypothetical protein